MSRYHLSMEVYSNEAIYLLALRRNQAVPVLVIRPHTGDPFWLAVEVARKPDHVTVRWWEEREGVKYLNC